MSPGKSSQIGSKDSVNGSIGNNCKGQTAHKQQKNVDANKLDSLASQLQSETEEKKESIMNEALKCIFNKLPETMQRLDALLSGLAQLSQSHYSNDALLSDGQSTDLKASVGNTAVKYKFSFDNASQAFPFGHENKQKQWMISSKKQQTSVSVSGKSILSSVCFCHLVDAKGSAAAGQSPDSSDVHSCVNSYTFANSISLLAGGTVPVNEEISNFLHQLRLIFVQLSQQFVIINLGLSLMFPRTEDNESSNLSLDVLNKLLNLASLEYLDLFENHASARASLIMKVASYPHFGESRRMLFEFDRNACLELQMIVQNLISQCGQLYDLLVKNLDMVLKVKETCNQQTRSKKPNGEEETSPSNNIYS